MTMRWFSILGTLAAGDHEVTIGEGAHAADLPPGDAGLVEIADRVRQHYRDLYAAADAHWLELHLWENEDGQAIRETHIERTTRTQEPEGAA